MQIYRQIYYKNVLKKKNINNDIEAQKLTKQTIKFIQMEKYNLLKADYANLLVNQRNWASKNPNAVYKTPLSHED